MRLFTFLAVLFFGFVSSAQTVDDFVFTAGINANTFNTAFGSMEISGTGPIVIDWGDGQTTNYTDPLNQSLFHTYPANIVYTIFISGSLDSFKMDQNLIPINVTQWGTSNWKSLREAFNNCLNISITATDNPDFSQLTNMSRMFYRARNFNSNISNWNVSNVSDMSFMFYQADNFNGNLSNWNVSSVTNMEFMFTDNLIFNSNISMWDVSNVTQMNGMFLNASVFNQPIGNWDVSNVTDMSGMFRRAYGFNSDLINWNVSNVLDMTSMFQQTNVFNADISTWDVSSVANMFDMFADAIAFNSDITNWDVSNVTDLFGMHGMFDGATSFNQPIGNWDVSNVLNMSSMFKDADSFNQSLGNWNVSNVRDMSEMFSGATNFNSDITSWDVTSVGDMIFATPGKMKNMFDNATAFNQNLSFWNFNTSGIPLFFDSSFDNSGLDIDNYDALLARFAILNLMNVDLGAQGLQYCNSFSRIILIQNGWNITGDAQSSTCSDNNLTGSVIYDIDNNGCNASDIPTENIAIDISNGNASLTVFTINGQYNVGLSDGTYTITPNINNALFTATPVSSSVTLSNAATVTQDFCVIATTPADDLEISILPLQDARPGFDTDYKIIYKNKGTTRLSGNVDFTYEDDFMDFLTANPAITSSSVGMLSWDFVDLDPFETREIEFSMNLNTPTDPNFPLVSGDILNFNATINPTTGDDTPLDNVFDLHQTVVNSYDPNDKTCLQGATILPTMVGEYVQYRIRFENEGTASAITVRIVDYIDTNKFDIATLIPLSASHDYTTTITEGNKVEFQFDNINLPFTAPASQGYVLFEIKTVDTLVLGDDFSNQAEIYFDFNFPIITNLETTQVAVPLSLDENKLLEVRLFPNPAQNSVSVTSNLEFHQYTIYNTLGAVVSQQKLESPALSYDIPVNHLVSGLYFVEVRGDQISSVLKLIKE
jgi:surface protein